MRLAKGPGRIVGVILGKAAINVLHPGIPPLTAEFGLLRDDEELAGLVEKRMEWSEKTMKALASLQDAMEEDMLGALFNEPPPGSDSSEPEQV